MVRREDISDRNRFQKYSAGAYWRDLKDKDGKVFYKKGFLITKEEAYNI